MTERPEQERIRFTKLEKLRAGGFAFPNNIQVTATAAQALESQPEDPSTAKRFSLAGRIVQLRQMGKAAFAHLLDGSGKIQLYVKKDAVGDASYEQFKD